MINDGYSSCVCFFTARMCIARALCILCWLMYTVGINLSVFVLPRKACETDMEDAPSVTCVLCAFGREMAMEQDDVAAQAVAAEANEKLKQLDKYFGHFRSGGNLVSSQLERRNLLVWYICLQRGGESHSGTTPRELLTRVIRGQVMVNVEPSKETYSVRIKWGETVADLKRKVTQKGNMKTDDIMVRTATHAAPASTTTMPRTTAKLTRTPFQASFACRYSSRAGR